MAEHPLRVSLRLTKIPLLRWADIRKCLPEPASPLLDVPTDEHLPEFFIEIISCEKHVLVEHKGQLREFLTEHASWLQAISKFCSPHLFFRVGYNIKWAFTGLYLPHALLLEATQSQLPFAFSFYPLCDDEDWPREFIQTLQERETEEINPFHYMAGGYTAILRVRSADLSPDQISSLLDLEPESTDEKGTTNRFGDLLTQHHWQCVILRSDVFPAIEEESHYAFKDRVAAFRELQQSARCFVDVGIFSSTLQAFFRETHVNTPFIELLIACGMDLEMSAYPPVMWRSSDEEEDSDTESAAH